MCIRDRVILNFSYIKKCISKSSKIISAASKNKMARINNGNKSMNMNEYNFVQLNFKKSLQASIEFIKRTRKTQNFVCLASEPYISFEKVGNIPPGSKAFYGDRNPRAAIIFDRGIEVSGISKLSTRDCAVAFIKIDKALTVIASIYCDITQDMICLLYTSPSPRD